MSVERPVKVRVDGKQLIATAFTTHPARASQLGPVSASFIEALARGAESAGLPPEYIERIRAAS